MTHDTFRLLSPLAVVLVACVPLPQPSSLDVELVVRDVGASVTRLAVEFESGADLRLVEPEVTRPVTRVFLADAPTGSFSVVVRAFDAAGDELVTATTTGSVGAARALVSVSLAPVALEGCDDPGNAHDDAGFACRRPLAHLPAADGFRPGRLVALQGGAVLLVEAAGSTAASSRRVLLVGPDGRRTAVLDDARAEGLVVSPGRVAALVPSAVDDDGESAVVLVVGGDAPSVSVFEGGRAALGAFGFVGDELAWIVTGADGSRLSLVSSSSAAPSQEQLACAMGSVRGPLAVADDGTFAAFEQMAPQQGDAFAFVLRGGGLCERSPEAPKAVPGSWAVSPDARAFAWRVLTEGGTDLHVSIPDETHDAAWLVRGSVRGVLGVDGLGRVYAVTGEGLQRFDADHHAGTVLSAELGEVVAFDSRTVGFDAGLVARLAEDRVVYVAPGQLAPKRVVGAVEWAGRRWLADGSLIVWEQASAGSGAWWLPPDAAKPFVFTDAVDQDHLVIALGGDEEVPLVGSAAGLVDLRTSTTALAARGSGAFDLGAAGLVYVDVASKDVLLRATLDAEPVRLSAEPALAAGVALESNRYWVVFENGDLASIGLPRGLQ